MAGMTRNKRARPISDVDQDEAFGPYNRGLFRNTKGVPPRSSMFGSLNNIRQRIVPLDSADRAWPAREEVGSNDDTTVVNYSSSHGRYIQSSIQKAEEELAKIKQRIADLNKLQAAREHDLKTLLSQHKHVIRNGKGNERVLNETDYKTGTFDWDEDLATEMEQVFGIRDFRLCQRGVCNAVMDRRDVFCVMPTGGGKSLTYQLPALLQDGCMLVISPLLSLISDQVHHLDQLRIEAVKIKGGISEIQRQNIYRRLRGLVDPNLLSPDEKEIKLVYVTPELICKNTSFQNLLHELALHDKIARIVIDEAHCVSEMGHDFREDYSKLNVLRKQYPNIPILALSATCPPKILAQVIKDLGLRDVWSSKPCRTLYFASPLYRKNLHYAVLPKPDEKSRAIHVMAQFIMDHHPDESGIVYCLRRKDTEDIARELMKVSFGKIKAGYYHAKKSENEKEVLYAQWQKGDIKVVCATIAFGLGINKGDVRFVLHYSISKSIETYYQESGRAGRDGKNSDCILYYRPQDAMSIFSINESRKGGGENVLSIIKFCEDRETCRKIQFAQHFSDSPNADQFSWAGEEDDGRECGHCDNCNRPEKEKEKEDLTQEAWKIVQVVKSADHQQAPSMRQLAEGLKDAVRLTLQEKKLLITHLLTRNILQVKLVRSTRNQAQSEANVYITLGPEAYLLDQPLDSLPRNVVKYVFIGRLKIPPSPNKNKQIAGPGADQDVDRCRYEAFTFTLPLKHEKIISSGNEQGKDSDDSDEVEFMSITPPRKKQKCAWRTLPPDDSDDPEEEAQSTEESEEEAGELKSNALRHDFMELSEDDGGCIVSYKSGEYLWSHSMCQFPPRRKRRRGEKDIYFVPDSEEE